MYTYLSLLIPECIHTLVSAYTQMCVYLSLSFTIRGAYIMSLPRESVHERVGVYKREELKRTRREERHQGMRTKNKDNTLL